MHTRACTQIGPITFKHNKLIYEHTLYCFPFMENPLLVMFFPSLLLLLLHLAASAFFS